MDTVSPEYALTFLFSETPGRTGKSPLHWASEYNQLEIARILLANGADVNTRAFPGESALDYASTDEMKKLLRMHGGTNLDEYVQSMVNKHQSAEKN